MRLLTILLLCGSSVMGLSQQVITSTMNGAATNPLVWDCICIPGTADTIIVNHAVTMPNNYLFTGRLTVNAGGSLTQTGAIELLFDAGGQLKNYGSMTFNAIGFTNAAQGHNLGTLSIDSALGVDATSDFLNAGSLLDVDSIATQGLFGNDGTIACGDILQDGEWQNDGGLTADSILNTGDFYNMANGSVFCHSIWTDGYMENQNDWQVDFRFLSTRQVLNNGNLWVNDDFQHGDGIGLSDLFYNDGFVVVGGNWLNNDSIDGSTGVFCIAGATTNTGVVTGTVDVCDGNGGGIDFNTGTIAPSVTFCVQSCSAGLAEESSMEVEIYPVPASDMIHVHVQDAGELNIYDATGQLMFTSELSVGENTIELNGLGKGVYIARVSDATASSVQRFVVK